MAVSFTGHRPNKLGGYDEGSPKIRQIKFNLRTQIERAISNNYKIFISGMAIGVDTWAAEIVLALREEHNLKLVCAVPFRGQEKKWPPKSQERYRDILKRADKRVAVCEDGYACWKMQKRNEWMVDHSDIVIAVWDGTNGGTGNCVAYAEKQNAMIWRIDPTSDDR